MKRRYITTLVLDCEAEDIGQVATWVQEHLAECFFPNGFALIEGGIGRAREDKPVETVTLGSSEAYANRAAQADLTGFEVVPTTVEKMAELGIAWHNGPKQGTRSEALA